MSELISNLNTIESVKLDIKSAIEAKGVSMSGVSFPDYPSAIANISTAFVTETLSVSINGTYTPGVGIDGYSQVTVDVPQSVTGFTEVDLTEGRVTIVDLSNSASFVAPYAFNLNKTLKTVNLPNCEYVGSYAFGECSLSQVSLPICTSIGEKAFLNCKSLPQVSLPECTSIGAYTFQSCYSLSQVSLPKCRYIGEGGFMYCSSLESISLINYKIINYSTFRGCKSLSQVSFPNCEYVYSYAFSDCINLLSIDLPVCSYIADSAFQNCRSLSQVSLPECLMVQGNNFKMCPITSLYLPKVQSLMWYAFQNCSSLSQVDLPNCVQIDNQVFDGCTSLSILSVGTYYYSVTSLANAFNNTPLKSGNGSIYVNAELYDKYIVANKWSEYASIIVSVVVPGGPLLSFSDGLVYGDTHLLLSNFSTFLGISKNDVKGVSLPQCSDIGSTTFQNCYSLSQISLPVCSKIYNSTFQNCSLLESINLPNCRYIGYSAFAGCKSLSQVSLPMCEYIDRCGFLGAFQSASVSVNIVLPICSFIGSSAFFLTNKINTITLGSNSVVSIGTSNVFQDAGLQSIYVPTSLVNDYKNDSLWASLSSKIFPIE